MANENENLDSEIEAINLDEISDVDVLKEHYQKLDENYRDVFGKNKQLFERTKKAEGFELKEGKWVKPKVEKPKVEPKVDTNPSKELSKPNELDMGGIAYLNSMVGLKGKDEIAVAREYVAQGKDILDLPSNKFFLQDLQTIRETKEHDDAIPKGKGRSAQTGATNIDIAYAKFQDTGEWPSDFETAKKLKDKIVEL